MFAGCRATLTAHNAPVRDRDPAELRRGGRRRLLAPDGQGPLPHRGRRGHAAAGRFLAWRASSSASSAGAGTTRRSRDRDWREPVDELELGYCQRDARDALELAQVYQARLRDEGLLDGYQIDRRARSCRPRAINLAGMLFDRGAHAALVEDAARRGRRARGRARPRSAPARSRTMAACPRSAPGSWQQVLGDEEDEERLARFCARLRARAGVSWRRRRRPATSRSPRRPSAGWPRRSPSPSRRSRTTCVAHLRRTNATPSCLTSFGESLADWVDGDGRLRGQLKVGGTVTLRHSASRPNTQQQPRRRARSGRSIGPRPATALICDYSPDRAAARGDHRAGRGAARGLSARRRRATSERRRRDRPRRAARRRKGVGSR